MGRVVYETLEGLGGVEEARQYAYELRQAEGSDNGRLGNGLLSDGDLVVCFGEVESGEYRVA